MSFWSDFSISGGKGFEPKRKFTFLLSIIGKDKSIENYLIKKVTKPGYETSESEHKFLNHTFYYPGKMKWNEVKFTVVDVINPNTSQVFLEMLNETGYRLPEINGTGGNPFSSQTVSKIRSVEALGIPRIRQIDHDGEIVDEIELYGAWIKSCEFGELSYDDEELMNIECTIRYDYCKFNILQPTPVIGLPG